MISLRSSLVSPSSSVPTVNKTITIRTQLGPLLDYERIFGVKHLIDLLTTTLLPGVYQPPPRLICLPPRPGPPTSMKLSVINLT